MIPLGMLFAFAAYTVGGYGYVLVRGYDIPFRSWVSPLNPYQWPPGGPSQIPDTQLWPSKASASSAAGG